MSTYTDWTPISPQYDTVRRPIGVHLYPGLAYDATGKTLNQLDILDAGCGTGNHVEHLLSGGLNHVTMFDADEGMLQKARDKLKVEIDSGKVVIKHHLLPDIPSQSGTHDVVMFNQVLHHLVRNNDTEFITVRQAIQESYRVLKPRGLVLVTGVTPYQLTHGYWFSKLIPQTVAKTQQRTIQPLKMAEIFKQAGFNKNGFIVEPQLLAFKPDYYFQEDGPLYDEWLNTNSFSAKANIPVEELNSMRETIEILKETGRLSEFVREADETRQHVGQYALFYAFKE